MTRRTTRPWISRTAWAVRRLVRSGRIARLVVAAVLFVASPSTVSIVEDALDLAGFACCDDESGERALGDCCPEGESHCAGCLHPTAIVPESLAALEAPFVLEIRYAAHPSGAPTRSHRTPPFRPPSDRV